ncbi:MAG TPA: AzlC family ABC transporter permease [Candidatus Gallacutalibacter stercoravium]|nr:AzlC family ABC transporter permease [Candidatus Gallacutalibacter stercoravium]
MGHCLRQDRAALLRKGIMDGLPICLGYLSVSFAFGMMAAQGGLPAWITTLISMTNFTSAGQVAGTNLILTGGAYVEIAITTFVINIRYMLMSLSLSQKLDPSMNMLERCLLAFGNTDEVFAVAMQQKRTVTAEYLAGLILTPYLGWTVGTLLGATANGILPLSVCSALGIAIYGMFIAIVVPPARKARPILYVVLLSVALSCLFRWVPWLNQLSSGWVIIICAVVASALGALRYPVEDAPEQQEKAEEEN